MQQAPFYIAFASESGNAQALAEDFAKRCEACLIKYQLCTLNELSSHPFAKSSLICFVSTTGNGELPINGRQFLNHLDTLNTPINSLKYALFALGSHSYSNFCGAGKALESKLGEFGAQDLQPSVYADEHFHAPYEKWALAVLSSLSGYSEEQLLQQLDEFARKPKAQYQLKQRIALTSEACEQQTQHLVFLAEQEDVQNHFSFEPGDVVSIQPVNDTRRIEALIETLQLTPSMSIDCAGEPITLLDYLQNKVEITKIGVDLIKKTGALLNDWNLLSIAANESQSAEIIQQYDVASWYQKHPIPAENRLDWLGSLTTKSPRFYSVANAPRAASSDEEQRQLHLCVGLQQQTEENDGLGSGYLCHRLQLDETVEFELETHPNFYMQSKEEMIWIATGTGIAPFIGFIAKLMHIFPAERPKVTLYFGVRHPEQDFLYKNFLQGCHEQGLIELKMAFSRQSAEKVYVQDRLKNDLSELSKALAESAHVYVCGSLPMWDAVETVLQHATLASCDSMEQAQTQWEAFTQTALHKEIY